MVIHPVHIGEVNLSGGASPNKFTLAGWTGTASLSGGGGTDTVFASVPADTDLSDTSLSVSGQASIGLQAIEIADLTGTGNLTFTVSGWTGREPSSPGWIGSCHEECKLHDFGFTPCVRRRNVTQPGRIVDAYLAGGGSGNRFDVTGWTGSGTLVGGGVSGNASDTVVLVQDADFTLDDAYLATTTGSHWQLVAITAAELTGGASDNRFYRQQLVGGGA